MAAIFGVDQRYGPEQVSTLKTIGLELSPHAKEIVNGWVDRQLSFDKTITIPREKLLSIYTILFYSALDAMLTGNIGDYFSVELPLIGKYLPESDLSYESLMISVHFLEESYLPYFPKEQNGAGAGKPDFGTFIVIDEFWHFWTAELASSYLHELKRSFMEEPETSRAIQEAIRPKLSAKVECLQWELLRPCHRDRQDRRRHL